MSEIELKACPFCGGYAELRGRKTSMVNCTGCSASTFQLLEDKESAVRQWNARAPQWQPIESAPKDGRLILACCAPLYDKNGFAPLAVSWRNYHPNAQGKEEWRDAQGTKVRAITHWQPLPAPPEVEG